MSEQTKTAVKQGGMNTKVRYITVTAMLSAVAFRYSASLLYCCLLSVHS